MTVDKYRRHMNRVYEERYAQPTRFLTGMFMSPGENYFDTPTVTMDIVRGGADIAIAVTNLADGYRNNMDDQFTNKEFTPPVYKESFGLNALKIMEGRLPGENGFGPANVVARATLKAFSYFRKLEDKINRSIELNAAQIFTFGKVKLNDAAGAPVYEIDFKPKATHFVTVGTVWSNAAATIEADILALCKTVNIDGLHRPRALLVGAWSWEQMKANGAFMKRFEYQRADLGSISGLQDRGEGAYYHGTVDVGNFKLDIFTYEGFYEQPRTTPTTRGAVKYYVHEKTCMVLTDGRLDKLFGACPRLVPPDARALPFLAGRMASPTQGRDFWANAWIAPEGEQVMCGVSSRPMLIPTAIDTFGCLYTDPADVPTL